MKHLLKTIGLSALLVGIPLMLGASMPVKAATYEFEPPTLNIPAECQREITVIVDTGSDHSNAADIDIYFNPAEITVVDSMPTITGVQVKPGDAYDSYVYNRVDNSTGLIRVAAGALLSDLSGRKTFITIKFQSKPGVLSSNFTIYYTGANHTLDSNVADTVTNLDLLTGVVNGTVTFNSQACNPDVMPPQIKITSPVSDIFTGPLIIETELSDAQSGVNVNSFQVLIDGVEYTPIDPAVSYSGNMFKYILTIDPNQFINGTTPSEIIFTVRDFAGNIGSALLILNPIRPTSTPIPTTPVPTTVAPTQTATPSPTALPQTGATPTPCPSCPVCPVYTDNTVKTIFKECQIIINQEDEKSEYMDIGTVNRFLLSLGKFNNILPGMGLLALLSLILNVQGVFGIIYLIIALTKWHKKHIRYTGVIYDKHNGNELFNAKVILYKSDGEKIAETSPDFHGRYFFDAAPGTYKVTVTSGNFNTIETPIVISEDGRITYHQMEYKDKVSKFKEWNSRQNLIFIKDSLVFAVLAFILSLLAVILAPGLITLIIFVLNLVVLILALIMKIIAAAKLGI